MTSAPPQPADPLPTGPQDLFNLLENLGISYDLHHHEAVFTVAESAKADLDIPGISCRNLYLRDKRKRIFWSLPPMKHLSI